MFEWNCLQYRRFESERTRPAADLLAGVPARACVRYAVDLGCGPGNSTELLVQRFAQAHVLGIDQSADMLAHARQRLPQASFEQADIASWRAPAFEGRQPDLIHANASLHWLPDHPALFPRLLSMLAPGGVFAVQMPDNHQEPARRLMDELAAEPPFAAAISGADGPPQRPHVLPLRQYYDLLATTPGIARVEIWRTVYQHPFSQAEAIVEWFKGSSMRPLLQKMPPALAASFMVEYTKRVDAAYSPQADGMRLLAFPRLFLVAERAA